jgi:tRNA (guanine37-N1)-methyltransferase
MRFDAITLFPEMFAAVTEHGITRRAYEQSLWSLATWNPRDFTDDAHRSVDDRPYGGGPGMVMLGEPLARAVSAVKQAGGGAQVVLLAATGLRLTDERVREIATAGAAGVGLWTL